jgi:type IX secretion system PorP/SprF family membrane protein
MKNFTLLILLNLLCLAVFSQSNIRLNNYWENTYYINPASIYSEYQFVASSAFRRQWIGFPGSQNFPGAPKTEYLTFAARLYTNATQNDQIGQIGVKVYHDIIGYTEFISISPSASRSFRLNTKWLMNLGFAYKIQYISFDFTKATFESEKEDLSTIESKRRGHNWDVGVEFVNNSFLLGAAIQNLWAFRKDNLLQTNCNFVYGMYRREYGNNLDLLVGACFIKNENVYQGEFTASGIIKTQKLPVFQLGLFYRTQKEVGALFGLNLSNTCRVAFSYDYHLDDDIPRRVAGSPEVLLICKFGKIRDCECEKLFK